MEDSSTHLGSCHNLQPQQQRWDCHSSLAGQWTWLACSRGPSLNLHCWKDNVGSCIYSSTHLRNQGKKNPFDIFIASFLSSEWLHTHTHTHSSYALDCTCWCGSRCCRCRGGPGRGRGAGEGSRPWSWSSLGWGLHTWSVGRSAGDCLPLRQRGEHGGDQGGIRVNVSPWETLLFFYACLFS